MVDLKDTNCYGSVCNCTNTENQRITSHHPETLLVQQLMIIMPQRIQRQRENNLSTKLYNCANVRMISAPHVNIWWDRHVAMRGGRSCPSPNLCFGQPPHPQKCNKRLFSSKRGIIFRYAYSWRKYSCPKILSLSPKIISPKHFWSSYVPAMRCSSIQLRDDDERLNILSVLLIMISCKCVSLEHTNNVSTKLVNIKQARHLRPESSQLQWLYVFHNMSFFEKSQRTTLANFLFLNPIALLFMIVYFALFSL